MTNNAAERDQAKEGEAAKAKELEELKVKYQKLKSLPPMPKPVEPKAAKIAISEPKAAESKSGSRLGLSQPIPVATTEGQPPRRSSHPDTSTPTVVVPDDNLPVATSQGPPAASQVQRSATAPRLGHPTSVLQSDQPKQAPPVLRGSRPEGESEISTSAPDAATVPKASNLPRAVSHDAVPSTRTGGAQARPTRATTPTPPQDGTQKSPNLARDDPSSPAPDGPRRLAVAAPTIRRTIANRPPEDNSLETNPLFQQKRLSTQGLLDPPQPTSQQASQQPPSQLPQLTNPHQATPQPIPSQQTTPQQTNPQQASPPQANPGLKRAASSLPSVKE